MEAFLIGATVGIASAVIGALLDYRLTRGRQVTENGRLPGCIFLVSGSLGFIGLVVTVLSLLLAGGLARPLIAGAGVVAGFLTGFVAMFILWLIKEKITR